jgi:hypothetical protein
MILHHVECPKVQRKLPLGEMEIPNQLESKMLLIERESYLRILDAKHSLLPGEILRRRFGYCSVGRHSKYCSKHEISLFSTDWRVYNNLIRTNQTKMD